MTSKKGFTIIELLVVTAISAILFAVAIAGFSSSNRRSDLISAMEQFTADLRAAQKSASVGEKSCSVATDSLTGYAVSFAANATSYTITQVCTPGTDITVTKSLPSGVSFRDAGSVTFGSVRGLVTLSDSTPPLVVTLKQSSGGYQQSVSITQAGVMNEGSVTSVP